MIGGSALANTIITPANGAKCKDEPDEHISSWTCPGPAGYAVQFWEEGNIVALTIAPARSIHKAPMTAG